ncbi:MAG: ABC transporter ATP-binding protein [Kiritimatiellia bacterium]|nr:ABC transporter ATP-binding protein [Lentisphaerota bacterium]
MNKTIQQKQTDGAMVLAAAGLVKEYHLGRTLVEVLRDVNLELCRGETLAVIGASGAGKSTLLHVLGGLERPSGGRVRLLGDDLYSVSARRRNYLRAAHIGFVFQFYHLLPELDVMENVGLPAMNALAPAVEDPEDRVRELLTAVGLAHRAHHLPMELSGGEQQRVALARALMNRPDILLADEPTGNLDPVTGGQVLEALFNLVARENQTLVMVTHNADVAGRCQRVLELQAGRLQSPAGGEKICLKQQGEG